MHKNNNNSIMCHQYKYLCKLSLTITNRVVFTQTFSTSRLMQGDIKTLMIIIIFLRRHNYFAMITTNHN